VHRVLLARSIQLCKSRQDKSRRQGQAKANGEKRKASTNLAFGQLQQQQGACLVWVGSLPPLSDLTKSCLLHLQAADLGNDT